jgi:hypothetical protein
MIKINTKFDGFNDRDINNEIEKQCREKLRSAGLSRVRVKVTKEAGKPSVKLDADSDEDLARAAKVLGIQM